MSTKPAAAASKKSWADDTDSPPTATAKDPTGAAAAASLTRALASTTVKDTAAPAPASAAAAAAAAPAPAPVRTALVPWNRETLSVQQANKDSPLFAEIQDFSLMGLSPEILKGLEVSMGFNKPSKIQATAIPMILANPPRNLIAQSQSGTGKTATFCVGLLARVNPADLFPQALCLCHSHEMALQTAGVIEKMGKYTGVMVRVVIPGQEPTPKGTVFQEQIIVATPGSLLDAIHKGNIPKSKGKLKDLRVVVYDEADFLLQKAQSMTAQVINVVEMIPANCQSLLFSATFAPSVLDFIRRVVPNADKITLERSSVTLDNIKQYRIRLPTKEARLSLLKTLYSTLTVSKSIIFVNEKKTADEVAKLMSAEGFSLFVMHSSVADRAAVMADFRNDKFKVLIATHLLARGVDIDGVSFVVMYDLPVDYHTRVPDIDTYIHAIGRTGRFGHYGIAINLVDQTSERILDEIERETQRKIDVLGQDEESLEALGALFKADAPTA